MRERKVQPCRPLSVLGCRQIVFKTTCCVMLEDGEWQFGSSFRSASRRQASAFYFFRVLHSQTRLSSSERATRTVQVLDGQLRNPARQARRCLSFKTSELVRLAQISLKSVLSRPFVQFGFGRSELPQTRLELRTVKMLLVAII